MILTLAVTAVVSFALSLSVTRVDPAFGFFATQSRAWEFAVGGLVAAAPAVRWPSLPCVLASWVGFAMVLGACAALNHNVAFPGWVTLIPTLGAAVVLATGELARRGSVTWALSRPTLGWLGDHSYTIYLWHWPPIVALPWVLGGPLGTTRASPSSPRPSSWHG